MRPIVNEKFDNVLSVIPMPQSVSFLKNNLSETEFKSYLPLFETGKPTKFITKSDIASTIGIDSYKIPQRYSDTQLASHIVGYMNNEDKGVYGIEKGYNDFLTKMGGEIKLTYNVNAYGRALGNEIKNITDTRYSKLSQGGVVLTLDKDIQSISEKAMQNISKGACVVMDVHTGEIVSMVSKPTFSQNNMDSAINSSDGALFNRAIAQYNVGSTFKTIVAAAAIENGISTDNKEICSGKYTLNDTDFRCHKLSGHWKINMWEAMARSCNVYFIELGQKVGYKKVINLAENIGFGKSVELAKGIVTSSGSLPSTQTITKGEFCNLCFGQGKLLATPVQISAMMSTVANGGFKVTPTLYKGLTENGYSLFKNNKVNINERLISENTAKTVNELLSYVVTDGSGKNAQSRFVNCAGKTGSAQTGQYIDGKEVVHAWFAGFFPNENPQYAITILEEGGDNGADKPAKAFKNIADDVTLLKNMDIRRKYLGLN